MDIWHLLSLVQLFWSGPEEVSNAYHGRQGYPVAYQYRRHLEQQVHERQRDKKKSHGRGDVPFPDKN
jgi:hypothetical protein